MTRGEAKRTQEALFKFSSLNLLILIKVPVKAENRCLRKAPDSPATLYKSTIREITFKEKKNVITQS
jgi:hypothetical protein